MGGDPAATRSPAYAMATVLVTGLERTVTVATDADLRTLLAQDTTRTKDHFLLPGARLLELGIRDLRERAKAGTAETA
jgi:hypothetical protein